jgi:hypothetical protein
MAAALALFHCCHHMDDRARPPENDTVVGPTV